MADGVPFSVQDLPECNNFLGAVATEPDNQVAKYAHAQVRSAAVKTTQPELRRPTSPTSRTLMSGLSLQRIDGRWYVAKP